MKAAELRDLTESDLRDHLRTVRRELVGLRFQNATGELDNSAGLAKIKREIARTLTIARERDIDIRS